MPDSLLADDTNEPIVDEQKNYLEELVGPNRKFKTPEDMAKGKYLADATLELRNKQLDQLREENLKLHEQIKSRASLEDLLDRTAEREKLASNNPPPVKEVIEKPAIDLDKLDELIAKRLSNHESVKTQQQNLNAVKEKLTEHFGSDYKSKVKDSIESLGLTDEEATSLAKRSPKAFFNLLGLDNQPRQSYSGLPQSTKRTDAFSPKVEKRTWSWYQDLKKKDPKAYSDRKTYIQMQKDAIELGEAFKDGDFNN